MLLELRDTLKSENNTLKQNISLMSNQVSVEKTPVKKTPARKKETSKGTTVPKENSSEAAPD